MLLFNQMRYGEAGYFWDFNTSNVTIQPTKVEYIFYSEKNFNTSNVTIQQAVSMDK